MDMSLKLTNDQRAVVRKAITAHPDWKAYSREHGVTSPDLTSVKCIEVCAALGINVQDVLTGETRQSDDDEVRAIINAKPEPKPEPKPVQSDMGAEMQALLALKSLLGGAVDEGKVRAIVDDAMRPVLEAIGKPALMVVDKDGKAFGKTLPPTRHPLLDTLLKCVTARDASGNRLNVWIAGPAGSGKTHAASQVAEALGLSFGFHGAMTMPHELVGFVDAGGTYRETVFVRMFRDGGVCLLDEVDAGSNEALLALNAALANGAISLPSSDLVKRHPDFVCIAAANTWGAGATADYIGRAKLDAAFLDRFGARLSWDYDAKLERNMCGNEDWAREVQEARAAARKLGLKVVITPRASMSGSALLASGMDIKEVRALTYLSAMTADQATMLRKELGQ
jgi:cobaltochelatase CobS